MEALREIRNRLRDAGGEFKVIKNTLAKLAVSGTTLDGIKDNFQGPVAIIIGYDDPVVATKVVKDFAAREDKLKIRIGVMEGQVLDLQGINTLAALPPLETLRASLVQQLSSPMAGMVGVLTQVIRKFMGVLDALKEKRGSGSAG